MARPATRYLRQPLSDAHLQQVRRERVSPQRYQWDYLHLREILAGLREAIAGIAVAPGPVLDLYCGTQPYREIIPWRPVFGLDIDLHFGGADVLGHEALPFRTASISIILCTQALYLVDDPERTVKEMARVLASDGTAIVTVPHLYRKELASERRYDAKGLRALFEGWRNVGIHGLGGLGTGVSYYLGSLLHSVARRAPAVRAIEANVATGLNVFGSTTNQVTRLLASRWPASFLLTAEPPR